MSANNENIILAQQVALNRIFEKQIKMNTDVMQLLNDAKKEIESSHNLIQVQDKELQALRRKNEELQLALNEQTEQRVRAEAACDAFVAEIEMMKAKLGEETPPPRERTPSPVFRCARSAPPRERTPSPVFRCARSAPRNEVNSAQLLPTTPRRAQQPPPAPGRAGTSASSPPGEEVYTFQPPTSPGSDAARRTPRHRGRGRAGEVAAQRTEVAGDSQKDVSKKRVRFQF